MLTFDHDNDKWKWDDLDLDELYLARIWGKIWWEEGGWEGLEEVWEVKIIRFVG